MHQKTERWPAESTVLLKTQKLTMVNYAIEQINVKQVQRNNKVLRNCLQSFPGK